MTTWTSCVGICYPNVHERLWQSIVTSSPSPPQRSGALCIPNEFSRYLDFGHGGQEKNHPTFYDGEPTESNSKLDNINGTIPCTDWGAGVPNQLLKFHWILTVTQRTAQKHASSCQHIVRDPSRPVCTSAQGIPLRPVANSMRSYFVCIDSLASDWKKEKPISSKGFSNSQLLTQCNPVVLTMWRSFSIEIAQPLTIFIDHSIWLRPGIWRT